MSGIVGSIDASSSLTPDISGRWELRVVVAANPERVRDGSLYCDFEPSAPCPDELVIITCDTHITQDGDEFEQTALCQSTEDSAVQLEPFMQSGLGRIDVLTGESFLEGDVEVVPGFSAYFKGEGFYAPDGQSSTMTTTAGADGNWLWLAVTTGRRLKDPAD
jgi:hypothetical protein